MSSAGSEVDTPQPTPPLPEKLARWLLRSEMGDDQSREELTALATRAYAQLRTHLALFLGEQGFDALWRRAIYLTRWESHTEDDHAAASSSATLPPGLDGAVRDGDAAEVYARLVATFASFITLLFTFIGEGLGRRLIDQAGPHFPSDAANTSTERALQ